MPAGIHGVGLDTTPAADPGMMLTARRGIWDLTLAINTLLPTAAEQAGQEADLAAARAGTMLAAELNDCYEGRLRTFLNPLRTGVHPDQGRWPSAARAQRVKRSHARANP